MKIILICWAVTLFVSPAFASVYKWQDASGRTHYEDISPTEDVVKVNAVKRGNNQIAKDETDSSESQGLARQGGANEARDPVRSSTDQIRNVQ